MRGRGGRGGASRGGRGNRSRARLTAEDIQYVFDRAELITGPTPAASEGAVAAAFDDALHVLVSASRPTTQEECAEFVSLVTALIRAAGDIVDNWKQIVLALVRRRYHSRSPAAVAAMAAAAGSAEEADGAGDGERLLFYLAIRVMQAASLEGHPQASTAAAVLCRMAPIAGNY